MARIGLKVAAVVLASASILSACSTTTTTTSAAPAGTTGAATTGGETKTLKSIQGGWPRILSLYKAKIETGTVPLGPRFSNTMMSLFAFMLPGKTRTEVALKADLRPPAGS